MCPTTTAAAACRLPRLSGGSSEFSANASAGAATASRHATWPHLSGFSHEIDMEGAASLRQQSSTGEAKGRGVTFGVISIFSSAWRREHEAAVMRSAQSLQSGRLDYIFKKF
ncbi:hypothetical protein E2C01_065722 [Portunus trituberculatus]|uniref:Uncharacterized protein n=1 Tax=Portunus trituberculatus TaxID=210409 RepID=A0A5B7HP69_PORTR|nr:hypothetical protein [Portunus trituberculatus]